MKYLSKGRVERGYGIQGVILEEHIFSLSKERDNIILTEECDGHFYRSLSKIQAIELFKECIAWVKEA